MGFMGRGGDAGMEGRVRGGGVLGVMGEVGGGGGGGALTHI